MVDIGIILLLLFMWCWDYPVDHPAKKFCLLFARPLVYMGMWHGWSMFAPEPIHVNRRLRALLAFDDGQVEEWRPMGPQDSSRLMKTLFARSFKFEHSLLSTRAHHLYEPLCEFLMRHCKASYPDRALLKIELMRDCCVVNPCGSDDIYTEQEAIAFYRYDAIAQAGHVMPAVARPARNQLLK